MPSFPRKRESILILRFEVPGQYGFPLSRE